MKKRIIIASVITAFAASAFTMATIWTADAKTSTVNWTLEGGGKAGTFTNLTSTINFDKANLVESKIVASIDVKTLKAGNEKLEAHLLTADFFDAEKFPKIWCNQTKTR